MMYWQFSLKGHCHRIVVSSGWVYLRRTDTVKYIYLLEKFRQWSVIQNQMCGYLKIECAQIHKEGWFVDFQTMLEI